MPRSTVAAVLAAVVVSSGPALTGCSGAEAQAYGDADVTFASEMVSHHQQALDMADLTDGRPLDPEVTTLVADIRESQAAEIDTMRGWLAAWDKPEPDPHPDAAMDMGGAMDGMMSHGQLEDLAEAPDATFQQQWLEMMIAHHEGAIEMAEAEVRHGRFPDAVALAEQMQDEQGDEVEQMREVLAR